MHFKSTTKHIRGNGFGQQSKSHLTRSVSQTTMTGAGDTSLDLCHIYATKVTLLVTIITAQTHRLNIFQIRRHWLHMFGMHHGRGKQKSFNGVHETAR